MEPYGHNRYVLCSGRLRPQRLSNYFNQIAINLLRTADGQSNIKEGHSEDTESCCHHPCMTIRISQMLNQTTPVRLTRPSQIEEPQIGASVMFMYVGGYSTEYARSVKSSCQLLTSVAGSCTRLAIKRICSSLHAKS
jgi:hypothetical protein